MLYKLTSIIVLMISILTIAGQSAYSQVGLGVSYEIRNEEPTNGFGGHVQFTLLNFPVVSLSARIHYSYYSEEISYSEGTLRTSTDLTNNEIGGTAIAAVSLGLVSPYAGIGIGWHNYSLSRTVLQQTTIGTEIPDLEDDEDSAIYYGVLGIAVTPLPLLRPFVEYRYAGITQDNLGPSSIGTWVFGVQFRL
jgi:opacity protein-like surface antigen